MSESTKHTDNHVSSILLGSFIWLDIISSSSVGSLFVSNADADNLCNILEEDSVISKQNQPSYNNNVI